MIVRCLACGKVMIADDKHPGFQVCGCKNETMVDWCDEYLYRLGGVDLSKIEVDGKIAGPKTSYKKKKDHQKLKKFWSKTWHIALSFLLGVAITTVVHIILTNHQVRKTAEAVCTVFGSDEQQRKDGIDNVLDMAEGVVDNNTNVKGE